MNSETAHQLTNHANLLYCCGDLEDVVPLFKEALDTATVAGAWILLLTKLLIIWGIV